MLRELRRERFTSLFVLWLVVVGLIVPPQAMAGNPAASVAETADKAKAKARERNGIAYVLQEDDDALTVARGLILEAREIGTNVVTLHLVRGPKDDPRILHILRELKLARLEVRSSIVDLSQAEATIQKVSQVTLSGAQIREAVAKQEAVANEKADYGDSWVAPIVAGAGKVVSIGEALLGVPGRLFRGFMTAVTGQEFRSIASFVVERDQPNDPNGKIAVNNGWLKSSFYTAALATAMIWVTSFYLGPKLSSSPDFQFSTLSERGYHSLIHVSYNLFFWVFLTLAVIGPLTAWKDQVVRIRYDENAPEGEHVTVQPNGFINFGLALLLEVFCNVMLPGFNAGVNSIKDGTASITNAFTFVWGQAWGLTAAVLSVFSYAVPNNTIGRLFNHGQNLLKPTVTDKSTRQRGARLLLYASVASFLYWSIPFNTAISLIRFIDKDLKMAQVMPGWLEWMNGAIGWVPVSALPMLALGTVGFGVRYGPGVVRGTWRGLRRVGRWLAGYRDDTPKEKRAAKSCAVFLVEPSTKPAS